jgi:hypothetical protein
MNCIFSANQPIYQALLGKANIYASSSTENLSYIKAAQVIANYEKSLYEDLILGKWCDYEENRIDTEVEDFINNFIKANPVKPFIWTLADAAAVAMYQAKIAPIDRPDIKQSHQDIATNFLTAPQKRTKSKKSL